MDTNGHTSIVLERADYFELRSLILALEVTKLETEKQLRAAAAAQSAKWEALAKAHSFDPTLTYRWDDATCALIVVDAGER